MRRALALLALAVVVAVGVLPWVVAALAEAP